MWRLPRLIFLHWKWRLPRLIFLHWKWRLPWLIFLHRKWRHPKTLQPVSSDPPRKVRIIWYQSFGSWYRFYLILLFFFVICPGSCFVLVLLFVFLVCVLLRSCLCLCFVLVLVTFVFLLLFLFLVSFRLCVVKKKLFGFCFK